VDVFELIDLIADELDELGFNWDIRNLGGNPTLRIWKVTEEEKAGLERLNVSLEGLLNLVGKRGSSKTWRARRGY